MRDPSPLLYDDNVLPVPGEIALERRTKSGTIEPSLWTIEEEVGEQPAARFLRLRRRGTG